MTADTDAAKGEPQPVAAEHACQVVTAQVADDDWQAWQGGECPVADGTRVEIETQGGQRTIRIADLLDWRWMSPETDLDYGNIVAYRVLSKPAPAVYSVGWIAHDGGECPLAYGTPVEVRLRGGYEIVGEAQVDDGRCCGPKQWIDEGPGDMQAIVAYRVLSAPAPAVDSVGDIHSDAKGSGARYNGGKPAYDLIPASVVVPFWRDAELTEDQRRALDALDALGMFQAREGSAHDVLRALGDHWDDCARVFEYGRRKYAAWNWAKGMAWSIPMACAARHLMAIIRGETHDAESGLPHAGHVFCNVVMLLTYQGTFPEGDDRAAKGLLL
ncbi:MAG: DUF5664 domain-containing protein [Hydrogenophaga sp.]|nr:DUF5664 domain-containing protein [Hydrogenophaga sp.]